MHSKPSTFFLATILFTLISFQQASGTESGSLSYDNLNRLMKVLESRSIDGVDCVPFYAKSKIEDKPIDPMKANFRIQTKEGQTDALKVTLLSEIPPEKRSSFEEELLEEEFTHIIWVPKGSKRYAGGQLFHDLPKGSISLKQSRHIKGSFQLKPKTQPSPPAPPPAA